MEGPRLYDVDVDRGSITHPPDELGSTFGTFVVHDPAFSEMGASLQHFDGRRFRPCVSVCEYVGEVFGVCGGSLGMATIEYKKE